MRSCWYLVLGWGISACAVGAAGTNDPPGKDGGAHDTGTFQQQSDSGVPLPGDDAGTPNDAGNSSPPDTGNNNGCAYTGTLATFDFSGEPGNQTSTPATSTATHVTAGDISRASALTAVSGTNSINSSAWATSSSVDPTRYYTFSLTPGSGCALDVGSVTVSMQASATGPTQGAVATSDDNFGATAAVASTGTTTATLSVSGATGAVEVRVYGYGASAAGGTMRINGTLTVSGSLH
jgi:hypothetical protein